MTKFKTTLSDFIFRTPDGEGISSADAGGAEQGASDTLSSASNEVTGTQQTTEEAIAANADTQNASGAGPYSPEGIDPQMVGSDDKATIDNLMAKITADGELAAKSAPPENASDYYKDVEVDDALKSHFENLANDPVAEKVTEGAKALGVSKDQLVGITSLMFSSMNEMGLLEDPVDPVKERQQLVPTGMENRPKEEVDQAIDGRMRDNLTFLKQFAEKNTAADADAYAKSGQTKMLAGDLDYVEMMLGDSASGHRFLETMRATVEGASRVQPGGLTTSDTSVDVGAQLQAEMAKPENNPSHAKFNPASLKALEQRYKDHYGSST